jgi:hypothetical protein
VLAVGFWASLAGEVLGSNFLITRQRTNQHMVVEDVAKITTNLMITVFFYFTK